ncbi:MULTISPECIES: hypothetical protein [Bacillus]|uniref:hypothetical protein n=1 Tax=Bacillus TaxID=1386 RepID=UPI0007064753|nr:MULTISPECIES: hypothetical protein [Bacillus]ALM27829.1 hypothetical protein AKO65_07310 [Bacillus altitudinis]ALM44370.1 hypothetical protein AMR71_03625 [Bacillus altitudinis]ANY95845.1 hypothetical protein AKO66_03625 [Bacillus altitudinis]MBU8970328.1 hypothetical protein [Bacillus altitudinis]MCA0162964.1 hypothetical protein [Bacillus sp. RAR_M1_44]
MESLERFLIDWVNHTKEGPKRSDLEHTDKIWIDYIRLFKEWEISDDFNKNELAKYIIYKGELKRLHRGHKDIHYDNHYVSWTSAEDLNQIYWFNLISSPYTVITAEATNDNPGFNIRGFIDAIKLDSPDYMLNTVNTYNEYEVVFPLQKNSIIKVDQF